ncbi:hypothetical protein BH09BAC3_BH09BAC3_19300 [soil metagenome]
MKNILAVLFSVLILLSLSTLLSGCQVIGDIFGAGVYTGMFLVVFVIVVIVVIIFKMTRKK